MVDIETFRKLALSFPGTEEQPHFDIPSFRVKNKIFATLWAKENRAMLKLSLADQSVFCSYDNTVFFPVPVRRTPSEADGANRALRLLNSQK